MVKRKLLTGFVGLLIVVGIMGGVAIAMQSLMPVRNYEGKQFVAADVTVIDGVTGEPMKTAYLELQARYGKTIARRTVEEGEGVVGVMLPAKGTQSMLERDTTINTLGLQVVVKARGYETITLPLSAEQLIQQDERYPFSSELILPFEVTLNEAEPELTEEELASIESLKAGQAASDASGDDEEKVDTTSTAPPPDLNTIEGIGLE